MWQSWLVEWHIPIVQNPKQIRLPLVQTCYIMVFAGLSPPNQNWVDNIKQLWLGIHVYSTSGKYIIFSSVSRCLGNAVRLNDLIIIEHWSFSSLTRSNQLTHRGWVTHTRSIICSDNDLAWHLTNNKMSSNHCWLLINRMPGNKLQWNLKQNANILSKCRLKHADRVSIGQMWSIYYTPFLDTVSIG